MNENTISGNDSNIPIAVKFADVAAVFRDFGKSGFTFLSIRHVITITSTT